MLGRFRLRSARRGDTRRVRRLFAELDQNLTETEVAELIRERKVLVLKEKRKKGLLGAATYTALGLAGIFSLLYVRRLAIDSKARGRGLGSLVIAGIKELARRRGETGFFLWSRENARGFYIKNKLASLGRIFWWRQK
jgi:GNAT superfamily N-acetyltransferase